MRIVELAIATTPAAARGLAAARADDDVGALHAACSGRVAERRQRGGRPRALRGGGAQA